MSIKNYFNKTVEETLKELGSNKDQGLTDHKVKELQQKYGLNELAKQEKESIWEKIKEQFEDTLVQILLGSAVISFIISYFEDEQEAHSIPAWVEPCVIFTILIFNAIVAIYQDLDAEAAIDKLMDLQSPEAHVLRNGSWNQIEARLLVPGDIVQVSQGDKIPADLRMIDLKTSTFKADQSILTGEANPVNKDTNAVKKTGSLGITDKTNYLFSGTLVNNGTAIGVVVDTAMTTEIGKIQDEVQKAAAEKKSEQSPIKQKISEFSDDLAKYIGYVCIACWLMNMPQFWDSHFSNPIMGGLYYFKVSVALAVAAIPEGLPAVITTCFALGSRRMAKHNAIIRKLDSVETLGCTTIICSDKTGTLTTNEMVVESFFVVSEADPSKVQNFAVEGISYSPQGKIEGLPEFMKKGAQNMTYFSQCMALCNESKLIFDKEKQKVVRHGLPTEAALKVLTEKIGIADPSFQESNDRSQNVEQYTQHVSKEYEKLATLEFTRDRKSMSVLMQNKRTGKNVMFIKGAPDYLLNVSSKVINRAGDIVPFHEGAKKVFENQIKGYAKRGLRTLAICIKQECGQLSDYKGPQSKSHQLLQEVEKYADLEADPIFIGVVAVRDPPRKEVAAAIKKCKDAGISVIMITGDIKETANSIAQDIGIVEEQTVAARSLTGHEFEALNDQEKLKFLQKVIDVPSGLVFSRTDPRHKRALVQLLGSRQQIVAMTGDGVNDAPALKQAQIGIAMGISGTEVAKEASDMVLADDNFSTIVTAVEEGRAIYANMKAFIRYMISSNIGEVVSIFLSSMLGIPDGFNSIQLLWVNLVTDGLPATALSFNPPDPDVMKKPPRKYDEPLISGFIMFRYFAIGSYVGIATVGVFLYWYLFYDWSEYGHQLIPFEKLRNFTECKDWADFKVTPFLHYNFDENPCLYFTWGKQKASTLSLTVLVMIEMFNALNALSDEASLLQIGIFANPFLLFAIAGSVALHCMICYVSFFETVFGTVSLTFNDWLLVLIFSAPVILLDEILKTISRARTQKALKERREAIKKAQ